MKVCEDATRHATEERGTECRPLLRFGSLERHVERGGDDSQPERAPRASAGDAAGGGLDPEPTNRVEHVAQPEGNALQHRPDERATVVPELEADERAARVGSACGVRSPARYGAKRRPSAPGSQPSASATSVSNEASGASRS